MAGLEAALGVTGAPVVTEETSAEVAADKDRSRERAIANWCMSFVRSTGERAAKMRDPALQTGVAEG